MQQNSILSSRNRSPGQRTIDRFGNPNKPSTPITGIIANTYANIAEDDILETYVKLDKEMAEKRRAKLVPHSTRATELIKEYNLKLHQKGSL